MTRVEPHEPTLEDLYFAVRQIVGPQPARRRRREHRSDGRHRRHRDPPRGSNCGHIWTVARTDLKQLAQARDYWIPMLILGGIFFVFVPTVLLFTITQLGSVDAVSQLSQALEVLPEKAQAAIQGDTEPARAGYALAVYLFAPVAVVVPITISTAVGAATIVGERERGTGEFLAHSPAGIREIFLGKLAASLVPGYLTTIVGFGIYSLIVNTIVGPGRRRLVLPHQRSGGC